MMDHKLPEEVAAAAEIEDLRQRVSKLEAERDEWEESASESMYWRNECLAKDEIITTMKSALRESKDAIRALQCNTDDYYDSAREASAQGDKAIATINKVLGEEDAA